MKRTNRRSLLPTCRSAVTILLCLSGATSLLAQSPANDNATGAIVLPTGAPCLGTYTNVNATNAAGEPYANCNTESTGQHSVWFSFQAPFSGAVKITTDNDTAGTLGDTKIGLFEASDASDYSTFNIIACDEDNGENNGVTDFLSTMYATGLTSGTTYYIQVDGRTAADAGTFCIQVQEINPTMLAPAVTCTPVEALAGNNPSYAGWVTMVDATGKLVALVRNTNGGMVSHYTASYHVNGVGFGTPRTSATGIPYMNRNFFISNPSVTTPVDLQFFVHPGEIATFNGGNTTTLNVTRQSGATCNPDFLEANGAGSLLLQTANGQVNGIGWVQVSTPGFSNFYIMEGNTPLPVELSHIDAVNEGSRHQITWTTAKELAGAYFELERSADSKHFSFLAKVAAKGRAGSYSYYDQSPLKGTSYYRLKMISGDGEKTYSKIVSAAIGGDRPFSIRVAPNPVTNKVTVSVNGGSTHASITVRDITGRQVGTLAVDSREIMIDMSAYVPGIYMIRYNDDVHTEMIKVSKQ